MSIHITRVFVVAVVLPATSPYSVSKLLGGGVPTSDNDPSVT